MTFNFSELKTDENGTKVVFRKAATGQKLEIGAADFFTGSYKYDVITDRARLNALARLIDEDVCLTPDRCETQPPVRLGDLQHLF